MIMHCCTMIYILDASLLKAKAFDEDYILVPKSQFPIPNRCP